MASRPPLVVGADGLTQQLQAGDDLNTGGWIAYTPTVAAASGSITATATGRYRKSGPTILIEIAVTISAVVLGATGLVLSLPVQASTFRWTIPGEVLGGSTLRGTIAASGSTMSVTTYSAGSPLATGTLVLCGFYEAASA